MVTGHDISPQVSCCLDDHGVHYIAGTGTAKQLAGRMSLMLCQAQYIAAAQQPTKLNLRRRPADLGDDRGRHHREHTAGGRCHPGRHTDAVSGSCSHYLSVDVRTQIAEFRAQ